MIYGFEILRRRLSSLKIRLIILYSRRIGVIKIVRRRFRIKIVVEIHVKYFTVLR